MRRVLSMRHGGNNPDYFTQWNNPDYFIQMCLSASGKQLPVFPAFGVKWQYAPTLPVADYHMPRRRKKQVSKCVNVTFPRHEIFVKFAVQPCRYSRSNCSVTGVPCVPLQLFHTFHIQLFHVCRHSQTGFPQISLKIAVRNVCVVLSVTCTRHCQ